MTLYHKIVVIFFIQICFVSTVVAQENLLLRAQASIFPKIVILDKDIEVKKVGESIVILIVHNDLKQAIAKEMEELLKAEYKSNLGDHKLIIETVTYDQFLTKSSKLATAYMLIGGESKDHELVTNYAENHHRVAFSYDYEHMQNNVLVSLLVKEKTYIYLNKQALKKYDIRFLPFFYKIVKVVE